MQVTLTPNQIDTLAVLIENEMLQQEVTLRFEPTTANQDKLAGLIALLDTLEIPLDEGAVSRHARAVAGACNAR